MRAARLRLINRQPFACDGVWEPHRAFAQLPRDVLGPFHSESSQILLRSCDSVKRKHSCITATTMTAAQSVLNGVSQDTSPLKYFARSSLASWISLTIQKLERYRDTRHRNFRLGQEQLHQASDGRRQRLNRTWPDST